MSDGMTEVTRGTYFSEWEKKQFRKDMKKKIKKKIKKALRISIKKEQTVKDSL